MSKLLETFLVKHPEEVAHLLESVPPEVFAKEIYHNLPHIEKIIPCFSFSFLTDLFKICDLDIIKSISGKVSNHFFSAIIRNLSTERQDEIFSILDKLQARSIQELVTYLPYQIGYYLKPVELVLSYNTLIRTAVREVERLEQHNMPIYVVDLDYALYGTLDLFSLIKLRDDNRSTIAHIVNRDVMAFKASISIENILLHPAWDGNQMVPVVGKTNTFFGVVSKSIISTQFRRNLPLESKKEPMDEYLYFSELLWKNMQGIWDIFK